MSSIIKFPKFWMVGFALDGNLDECNLKEIYAYSSFEAASIYLCKFINEKIKKGEKFNRMVVAEMTDAIVCIDYSKRNEDDNDSMTSRVLVNDIIERYGANIIDLVPFKN